MKVVRRTEIEVSEGKELDQLLAGCLGAVLTTLPSFIVLPIWLCFIKHYKIVDDSGKDENGACVAICFIAGIMVWGLVAIARAIGQS